MNLTDEIRKRITVKYGEVFAERCLKHCDWIDRYDGYGAPGHMDYVIIQILLRMLVEYAQPQET